MEKNHAWWNKKHQKIKVHAKKSLKTFSQSSLDETERRKRNEKSDHEGDSYIKKQVDDEEEETGTHKTTNRIKDKERDNNRLFFKTGISSIYKVMYKNNNDRNSDNNKVEGRSNINNDFNLLKNWYNNKIRNSHKHNNDNRV